MRRDLILGPPGTGKTTRLLDEIERLRTEGYDLNEIGFVSFSRRAIREARERGADVFRCSPDDVPWFRTLHSAFSRVLGLRAWMEPEHYQGFTARYGYRLTEGASREDDDAGWGSGDDKLLATDSYARARLCSLNEAARRTGASTQNLQLFAERHRAFRREVCRFDFTDILEESVRRGARLPVRVLIIDEAQDLSPLQIAALEATIAMAEVVIVAGDDDQAIYAFQGAAPEWIISLTRDTRWRTEVLSRSWRVPARVHALAERIIGRCRVRAAKSYTPRDADGEVIHGADDMHARLVAAEGQSAYLARTRAGTRKIAHDLFTRRDAVYLVQQGAGPNPLGKAEAVQAVHTAWALTCGEPIAKADLLGLLGQVPSRHPLGLLGHGVKTAVERHAAPIVTPADVDALGLGRLRDYGRSAGHCEILLKMEPGYRAWYAAIWRRHGRLPAPSVILSTIHGAKGAEWGTVAVAPDHPKMVEEAHATREGRDAEHRVAYVAATRARERLLIARREGAYGYPYP